MISNTNGQILSAAKESRSRRTFEREPPRFTGSNRLFFPTPRTFSRRARSAGTQACPSAASRPRRGASRRPSAGAPHCTDQGARPHARPPAPRAPLRPQSREPRLHTALPPLSLTVARRPSAGAYGASGRPRGARCPPGVWCMRVRRRAGGRARRWAAVAVGVAQMGHIGCAGVGSLPASRASNGR